MRPELQKYFKDVAEQYKILQNVRFHSTVEKATWDESTATWLVTIKDHKTKQTVTRRCKILISAVGALSVPRECETPGVESFEGKLFHSAKWDHRFDWQNKDVVVLGMVSLQMTIPSSWSLIWQQEMGVRQLNSSQ
jgi:cation diffusion facilitator CzcD-associated flavoprotein CzcO